MKARKWAALIAVLVFFWPAGGTTAQAAPEVKVLIATRHLPGPSEEDLVRRAGGRVKYTFHLVPAIAATVPQPAIGALLANPIVASIDRDTRVHATDLELDNTWGVKRIGAGAVQAIANRGTRVKVAIIDTGIDYNHPDLKENFAGGRDFFNNDSDPLDDNGHGTHVAGTIAAMNNDVGVVGVAPEAHIFALKVLDATGMGDFSDVIAALEWAVDNGIQVTNSSFGDPEDPGPIARAAFDNSAAAGIVHVAAAGNLGNAAGDGTVLTFPAAWDSVIAVGAIGPDDTRAFFSSTGPKVELAAPGFFINSTIPGGRYAVFTGTSMASPHVAGTAALVIASGIKDANGDGRINDEVRERLDSTADDLGVVGRDPWYGFGLVNAARARGGLVPSD